MDGLPALLQLKKSKISLFLQMFENLYRPLQKRTPNHVGLSQVNIKLGLKRNGWNRLRKNTLWWLTERFLIQFNDITVLFFNMEKQSHQKGLLLCFTSNLCPDYSIL